MSASEKDVNPEANTDSQPDEPIIEAEIVEETEASPSPQPSSAIEQGTPEKSKSSGNKLGWWFALILAAFIGGLFAAPYAEESLVRFGLLPAASDTTADSGNNDTEIAALRKTIATLQGELRNVSRRLASAPASDATNESNTNQRISAIEDDMARLSGLLENAPALSNGSAENAGALEAEISRLSDDVARLSGLIGAEAPGLDAVNSSVAIMRAEANQLRSDVTALRSALTAIQAGSIEGSPRGRLILALGRIENTALSGQAFATELETLRADTSSLPVLDQQKIGAHMAELEPHGAGIMPIQSLLRAFPDVAAKTKLASEKESGSFLASLFTVRRTDAHASGVDAVLIKAEKRLVLGDLAGTVEVLDSLEGDAKETAKEWRDDAAAYLSVQNAFAALRQTVARAQTTSAGGGA